MSFKTIKNDQLTVKINTYGAELTSVVNKSGKEYMWDGKPEIWEDVSPILFPIVSRLENDTYMLNGKEYKMGMHGFAKDSEFEVEKHTDTELALLLKSSDETKKCYPFDFEFRVIYTLCDNKLIVDFDTTNKSDSDMYYSAGSHEGFACPGGIENYSVIFDENETVSKYEVLPEGEIGEIPTPILNNECEIKLKKEYFAVDALIFFDAKSRGIALRNDITGESIHVAYPGFDTLLIWTLDCEGADYVCIEPWAGAPDLSWKAVDDFSKKYRIMTLKPGATDRLTHTITF